MPLITRASKGSPLTSAEMDANLTYLEGKASSGGFRGTFASYEALSIGVSQPIAGDFAHVDVANTGVIRYVYDATDSSWQLGIPLLQQHWRNTADTSIIGTDAAKMLTSTDKAIRLEKGCLYEFEIFAPFKVNVKDLFMRMKFAAPTAGTRRLTATSRWTASGGSGSTAIFNETFFSDITSFDTFLHNSGQTAAATIINLLHVRGVVEQIDAGSEFNILFDCSSASTSYATFLAGAVSLSVRKIRGPDSAPLGGILLGPELVSDIRVYPWTMTNGVTATNANSYTAVSGGNMLFNKAILTAGKTYAFSFDTTYTSGVELRLNTIEPIGGSDLGDMKWPVQNGKITGTVVAKGATFSIEARGATFNGTVSNLSIKEVL